VRTKVVWVAAVDGGHSWWPLFHHQVVDTCPPHPLVCVAQPSLGSATPLTVILISPCSHVGKNCHNSSWLPKGLPGN
jgi:hypothetical protein